jgi:hypothetical protein
MQFDMYHLMFGKAETFYDDAPPKWLLSQEYKWWYDAHVLTLKVGQSISTDFNEIKRIA